MATRTLHLLKRRLAALDHVQDRLGHVILSLDPADLRVRRRAAREVRSLVQTLRSSFQEAAVVVQLFSAGFGAHRTELKGGTLRTRRGDAMGRQLRRIVSSPNSGASLALRIFTVFAVGELEWFVREFARWWLTRAEIAKFRASPTCARMPKRLAHDDAIAREQIIDWLKPTASSRYLAWGVRLRRVFRCRIDESVTEAFKTLIMWRNEFAHLGRRRHRIRWMASNGPDIAEAMVCWIMASMVLSVRLGEASFQRLP
jgi:hypothetical protein